MADPYVDTNVIVRLLAGDDPVQQKAAQEFFREVREGSLIVTTPETVVGEVVFVLGSKRLYGLTPPQIQALLEPLLRLPRFQVQNRSVMLRALEIYATTNLEFGDSVIVAAMRRDGASELYSFDRGFDRISDVKRLEP